MTRPEFEKSDRFSKGEFIMKNIERVIISYNSDEKEIYCDVSSSDGFIEQFEVYEFFRLYGIMVAFKTTDEQSEIEQMNILVEARSKVIHLVENIKRLIEGVELRKEYRLSGFVKGFDALILMSKMGLENKLLTSQLDTNISAQQTNESIRLFNKNIEIYNSDVLSLNRKTYIMIALSVIAAIMSAIATVISVSSSISDNSLKAQIQTKSQELLLSKQENMRLNQSRDSLEIILLKQRNEPQK